MHMNTESFPIKGRWKIGIIDTDSYIKETNRQLPEKASYKQLTQNPTLQDNRMVNQTIGRFKNKKHFLKKLQMV